MNSYQEDPILFGPEGKLLGVVTRPADRQPGRVACLMFNFGVMHRVGPRRIHVKLARRLAAQGVATLRFDLSGLGDSRASDTSRNFEEQAGNDLRAAIDELQARLGITQVIVIGLCSGARHGLQATLKDPRIVGLLTFDGYSFTSRGARLQRRLRRLVRFPVAQTIHWTKMLLGTYRTDGDLLEAGTESKVVTPEGFQRDMETLIARGVSIYLVYSATFQGRDRNRDQLHALRGAAFLDQVRYEFMPNVDHSFTEVAGQDYFIDAVSGWVGEIQARHTGLPAAAPATIDSPAMRPMPARAASALASVY